MSDNWEALCDPVSSIVQFGEEGGRGIDPFYDGVSQSSRAAPGYSSCLDQFESEPSHTTAPDFLLVGNVQTWMIDTLTGDCAADGVLRLPLLAGVYMIPLVDPRTIKYSMQRERL